MKNEYKFLLLIVGVIAKELLNYLINNIKRCGFEIIKSKRTSGKMFDNNIEDGNFIFRRII